MTPLPPVFIFDAAGDFPADCRFVRVPTGVESKVGLLSLLYEQLAFSDFGHNWDALEDCLRDLTWIAERVIVIAHDAVPALSSDDLRNYLEVLMSAASMWRSHPDEHSLIVVFPPDARESVLDLVRAYDPQESSHH